MYSICLFCNQSLGANKVVESFPVGRRLAFDQKRGRLWVLCRKCEKWNLTPLEERWEAIEKCEQLFRDTKKRVSTDNIGLARLNEGLELVRIGEPQRPEFAAWRYGDQFGRRHRRSWVFFSASMAITFGYFALHNNPGFVGAAVGAVGSYANSALLWGYLYRLNKRRRRVLARMKMPTGSKIAFKLNEFFRLVPDSGSEGWALDVHHTEGSQLLKGRAALHAMPLIMAHINHEGGSKRKVSAAVNRIESIGDPAKLLRWVAPVRVTFKSLNGGGSLYLMESTTCHSRSDSRWRCQSTRRTSASHSKVNSRCSRTRGRKQRKSRPSPTTLHCRVPLSVD